MSLASGTSEILQTWDWRFRVAFEPELETAVREAARVLEPISPRSWVRAFLQLLDVCASTVWLGSLLEALDADRDPNKALAAIQVAESKLLGGMSPAVVHLASAQIERTASWLPDTGVRRVRDLLRRAAVMPWVNPNRQIAEIVFGDRLSEVLARGDQLRSQVTSRHSLGPEISASDFEGEVSSFLRRLRAREDRIPAFDVEIESGDGFGEYWPAELRTHGSDKLVINRNADNYRLDTLQHTLTHEVLGHGTYYRFLRGTRSPWVDHGALALIEGWATWCEWRLHPEPRGPDGATLAWIDLLDADASEVEPRVTMLVRAQGFSEARVATALFAFSQFPAYQLSYLLGALWFDIRAEGRSSLEVLYELDGRPLGDFLFGL